MSQYSIVAEMVQSNKSNNNVWFVHVTGCDNPELQGYLSVGGSTSVTGHSSGDRTVTAKILLES